MTSPVTLNVTVEEDPYLTRLIVHRPPAFIWQAIPAKAKDLPDSNPRLVYKQFNYTLRGKRYELVFYYFHDHDPEGQ